MRRFQRAALLPVGVLASVVSASGYAYFAVRPSGSIPMELQLGSATWNSPADDALFQWNQYLGRSRFTSRREAAAPIGGRNGYNNVVFSNTVNGSAFEANVLAVTASWGSGITIAESDVTLNLAFTWGWYNGPRRQGTVDIHRVLLHEFGHVLGLDHPDEYGQNVTAIMNSHIGDLDHLVADDIAGANYLYGGTSGSGVTAPGAPSSLTAGAISGQVTLAWRAPTSGGAPSGYIVEAGSVAGATNLANVSTGTTATTYGASNVGAGVFYIRVRATNAAGVSPPSNEAVLVVGGSCSGPPSAPSALIGSASGATVTLAWNAAVGNPLAYIVEAGSGPGLVNLANSDTGSAVPSMTATGVSRGIYYVRVRARNACGLGPVSNEIVVIVQ